MPNSPSDALRDTPEHNMPLIFDMFAKAGVLMTPDYYGFLPEDGLPDLSALSPSTLNVLSEDLLKLAEGMDPYSTRYLDPTSERKSPTLSPDKVIPELLNPTEKTLGAFEVCCIAVGALDALRVLSDKGWRPYVLAPTYKRSDGNALYQIAKMGEPGIAFLNELKEQGYDLQFHHYLTTPSIVLACREDRLDCLHYFLPDLQSVSTLSDAHKKTIAEFISEACNHTGDPTTYQVIREFIRKDPTFFAQGEQTKYGFERGTALGALLLKGDLEAAEWLLSSGKVNIADEALTRTPFLKYPQASADLLIRFGANRHGVGHLGSNALAYATSFSDPYDSQSLVHYFLELGLDPRAKNENGTTAIGQGLVIWPLERLQTIFNATPADILASTTSSSFSGEGLIPSLISQFKRVSFKSSDESVLPVSDRIIELFEFIKEEPAFRTPAFFEKAIRYTLLNPLPEVLSWLLPHAHQWSINLDPSSLFSHLSSFPCGDSEAARNECIDLFLKHPPFQSAHFEHNKQVALQRLLTEAHGSDSDPHPDYQKQMNIYFKRLQVLIKNGAHLFGVHQLERKETFLALTDPLPMDEGPKTATLRKSNDMAFATPEVSTRLPLFELRDWLSSSERFKNRVLELLSLYEAVSLKNSLNTSLAQAHPQAKFGTHRL